VVIWKTRTSREMTVMENCYKQNAGIHTDNYCFNLFILTYYCSTWGTLWHL
jgi:hypothetical protein